MTIAVLTGRVARGARDYLAFVAGARRLLAFGFLLMFASSFGQTFYIAVFGGEIRVDLDLSHGEFGLAYSLATLASGMVLLWAGRLIDRVDLRAYTWFTCIGMALAALALGAVDRLVALGVPAIAALGGAFFLLRLFGQGLMAHTSLTSMARYFDADRGKALSFAAYGFSAGLAVLPLMGVALIDHVGWQLAWLICGIALLAVLGPLTHWLLKGHRARHQAHEARSTAAHGAALRHAARQWTVREVIRDRRFHFIAPAIMAPSFIVTGFMFHQVFIAGEKGWSLAWLASCFIAYALSEVATSFVTGLLIDRFGAVRLLPYLAAPMAATALALALIDHDLGALVFMGLLGVINGMNGSTANAAWAEMYGVRHLGAIRAMTFAIIVLASSLSPMILGWGFDAGISVTTTALACVALTAAGALSCLVGVRVKPSICD